MLQPKKHIACLLLAWPLLCFSPVATAQESGASLTVKPGVPEGFEQLAAPQATNVDVVFGGDKIGSFRAVYSPKTIAFVSPEEIVAAIPALKPETAEKVKQALTGELPTQIEAACGHIITKDCGILKPDVAGVIFYEESFRADLFVSSSLLAVQDTHMERILPPAPNLFSAIHQINGNVTGNDSTQEFSVLDNSILAYGAQRLQFIGIASNRDKQINTFAASMDRWGMESSAGLFNSHALQLLPQMSMGGVSMQTSLKTNLAIRDSAGSSLEIFLPQRSYVSLVYNGVIYSTDMYDAGNQILNTSNLPEGAYDVTIKIRTLDGVETQETRFFAKNFAIPPKDQPIYFGQVGQLRDPAESNAFNSISNTPIATAGMIRRLTESLALDVDVLSLKDKIFAEIGTFLLMPPNHQLRISSLFSSDQDMGIGGSYIGYFLHNALSFSANARYIISGETAGTTASTASTFDFTDPINGDSKQLSGSFSYQVTDRLNIGLDSNYTDSGNTHGAYSYGPRMRYNIWRNGPNNLTLTSSYNNTDKGPQGIIYLNFTMRMGDWGLSGQSSFSNQSSNNNYQQAYNGRVTWNDDKNPDRFTVIGAEKAHDDKIDSYIMDLDHRASYGNLKLLGSQTDTSAGQKTFYNGNFGFSIAHTAHDFAWGGRHLDTSGLIFKNEGNSTDVPMKIMVDGAERATFDTGHSTPLFLSPYHTYKVNIKPVQSSAIDYDGTVKNITLYPGNIMPMVWDINKVMVVVGHVILPDGTPLSNARLVEARNITITDEAGLFQGELLQLKNITFRQVEDLPPSPIKNPLITDFSLPPMPKSYPFTQTNMSLEEQRKAILDIFDSQYNAPPAPPKPDLEPLMTTLHNIQKTFADMLHIKLPEKPAVVEAAGPPAPTNQAVPVEPVQAAPLQENAAAPAPEQGQPVAPSEEAAPQTQIAATPPAKPAFHCSVTLPEVKETNGVYIFSEPLVCNPLPDENLTEEDKKRQQANYQRGLRMLSSNVDYGNIRGMFKVYSRRPTTRYEAPRSLLANAPAGKTPIATMPDIRSEGAQPAAPVAAVTQSDAPLPAFPPIVPKVAAIDPVTEVAKVEKIEVPAAEEEDVATAPAADPEPELKAIVEVKQAQYVGVQVGSYRSESGAIAAREKLAASSAAMRNRMYNIIRADLGAKGIYYRLRIEHFLNKQEASDFCKTLEAEGHSCILSKN